MKGEKDKCSLSGVFNGVFRYIFKFPFKKLKKRENFNLKKLKATGFEPAAQLKYIVLNHYTMYCSCILLFF
jgi:hypothetical protein